MSRVESPFVEPSVGVYFESIISVVFSPQVRPFDGGGAREWQKSGPHQAAMHYGLPPAEICRDGQLEGWRASGPWPIASDLNGSVCNQTCPFNLHDRITVGVSRTSVVPSAPVAKPLRQARNPLCPSSVWRGRCTGYQPTGSVTIR